VCSSDLAVHKTHFVIVDAIGVTETDKTDTRPLERKRSVPFDQLLLGVALGKRDEDMLTSLAGRLARLDREVGETDRADIEKVSGGTTLHQMANGLLDAVDPDVHLEKARALFNTPEPGEEQVKQAAAQLTEDACRLFDSAELRSRLIEAKQRAEQTIDTVSKDEVLFAGSDESARERARSVVESFERFIAEHKDELTALQIIYSRPYGQRHLTYEAIKELATAIERPPYALTPSKLWQAYEQLERSKVRGAGAQRLLTDLISLLRFAAHEDQVLEPFSAVVARRFQAWLGAQQAAGRAFTSEQIAWLNMIRDQIASSGAIGMQDFEEPPFFDRGGPIRAQEVFGDSLESVLGELQEVLVA
jgi:type I restriction enzyme R subunit